MITTFIISVVVTVIQAIDGLLPSFTLPSFFAGGSILPSGVVTFLAAALYSISSWFPSSLLLSILSAAAALWPAVLGYYAFTWMIRHSPTIAGFGLGAG